VRVAEPSPGGETNLPAAASQRLVIECASLRMRSGCRCVGQAHDAAGWGRAADYLHRAIDMRVDETACGDRAEVMQADPFAADYSLRGRRFDSLKLCTGKKRVCGGRN